MLAHPEKLWPINTDLDVANGYRTKMSPRKTSVALVESQYHIINAANPCRALDNGVEDRVHIRRRTADDAEHLGGCRLMLYGFPQFLGSRVLPPQRLGELLAQLCNRLRLFGRRRFRHGTAWFCLGILRAFFGRRCHKQKNETEMLVAGELGV